MFRVGSQASHRIQSNYFRENRFERKVFTAELSINQNKNCFRVLWRKLLVVVRRKDSREQMIKLGVKWKSFRSLAAFPRQSFFFLFTPFTSLFIWWWESMIVRPRGHSLRCEKYLRRCKIDAALLVRRETKKFKSFYSMRHLLPIFWWGGWGSSMLMRQNIWVAF